MIRKEVRENKVKRTVFIINRRLYLTVQLLAILLFVPTMMFSPNLPVGVMVLGWFFFILALGFMYLGEPDE